MFELASAGVRRPGLVSPPISTHDRRPGADLRGISDKRFVAVREASTDSNDADQHTSDENEPRLTRTRCVLFLVVLVFGVVVDGDFLSIGG